MLEKRPVQNAIILWELARAGERGISSYLSYSQNYEVHRIPARIDDLETKFGCRIDHHGRHPATYILREVPPETIAYFYKENPALDKVLDHYVRLPDSGNLTPMEERVAEKEGNLVRRFDPKTNMTWTEDPAHPRRCRLCGSGMGNLVQKDGAWEHDETDQVAKGFCAAQRKLSGGNGKT